MKTVERLNKLAEIRRQMEEATAEIDARIKELEAEKARILAPLKAQEAGLAKQIKKQVRISARTFRGSVQVNGKILQAVYQERREADIDALERDGLTQYILRKPVVYVRWGRAS